MVQSNGNERLTLFVSMAVAVAILAAAVTAHQSSSPKSTDVVQMGSDLRFQLEMAFRHKEHERSTRLAQLDEVMAAWQKSTQSDADREVLIGWLQEAGASSLPGVMRDLPASPEFSRVQPPVEHKVMKAVATEEATPVEEETVEFEVAAEEAPITPTAPDPLEEEIAEIVTLRQPSSFNPGERGTNAKSTLEIAPRPGTAEQPQLLEENLLETVVAKQDEPVGPVGVNFTELAARITGYHEGLDQVNLALTQMRMASLEVVAEQIKQLESLARDYTFVELYYDSLSQPERQMVHAPRDIRPTLDETKEQLDLCAEVLDGDFLGAFDKAAEKEIEMLQHKLAEIRRHIDR